MAEAYDLLPEEIRTERMLFSQMTEGLRTGTLSAGLVLAGFPFPAITSLARETPIRLLSLHQEAADRIRERYPFYKPAVIPANTYPGQTQDVAAVGVDNLLLCREDLDEQIVYAVTKALFDGLPRMVEVAADINPDLAPATPVPLHPGAARYYRERELLQ
jgi:TRAP transporter TAXI family solute receptor